MVRRIACLMIAALLWIPSAEAATLTASVDRTEVSLDDHIILTLKLLNSDTRLRARGVSPNVDLTLLSDHFEVGVPRTQHRFELFRGRGRATSELRVELFPREQGRFEIPPFAVDGLRTEPITVTVVAAPEDPAPEVFVESGVTKDTVWQREQTVAYLDLFYRVELENAEMGDHLESEPLDIGLMKLPQSERQESRNGFTYNVQRVAWSVTPLHSGTLKVFLPDVWVETTDGERIRRTHRQQAITVKALPAAVPPETIVGRPSLSQDMTPNAAEVDEMLSWQVTLKAPASANMLPDALPLSGLPSQFKFYLDRPERRTEKRADGITGIATYTVSAIPLEAGRFEIPALEIPYFDPRAGRMRSLTQAGLTLNVAPASRTPPPTAGEAPATATATPATTASDTLPYWQAGTVLFAALWLVTTGALLLRRRRRPPPPVPAAVPVPAGDQPLKTRLLSAFDSATLEEGLNDFERRHGIDPFIRDTVQAVQKLCYGKHKDHDTDGLEDAVKEAADRIKRHRTRPGAQPGDPWSPRAFTPGWKLTSGTAD